MNLKNPAQSISHGTQKSIFGLFFGLTLILMVIFGITGGPLNTEAAPLGIVSFELAWSVEKAEAVLSSWDDDAQVRAGFSLGLDFLFIPIYVAALSLGCALSSGGLEKRGWPLVGYGRLLAFGVCAAGLLDVIENISLLAGLFGAVSNPFPQVAAVCAGIKFILIFIALVFILYGGVISMAIREPNSIVKN